MDTLLTQTEELFQSVVDNLQASPWEDTYVPIIQQIKTELYEPCILAVAGQVSAGKSTFVNALLNKNLAETGINETTATLTYFRYGTFNEQKPVKCYWKNGAITHESLAFMNKLQGFEEQIIKKLESISHFEINIAIPFLKDVTLVDTPGTGSKVQAHETRSKAIVHRHHTETEKLCQEASAVIYLIGSPTGNIDQKKYLEDFKKALGSYSKPINAVGVMSRIDESEEVIFHAGTYARDLSNQLKNEINKVVPVSVALYMAVKMLDEKKGFQHLQQTLHKIPQESLDILLSSYEIFDNYEIDDCPVSPLERKRLREYIPWTVFCIIAKTVYTDNIDSAIGKLYNLSGFLQLKDVLDQQFFKRSRLLTCYNATLKLKNLLNQIERQELPLLKREEKRNIDREQAYITFMKQIGGNSPLTEDIIEIIQKNFERRHSFQANSQAILACIKKVDLLLSELEIVNDDFYAISEIQKNKSSYQEEHMQELFHLFGLYGTSWKERLSHLSEISTKLIAQRQIYWRNVGQMVRFASHQREIASLAEIRYGNALYHFYEKNSTA